VEIVRCVGGGSKGVLRKDGLEREIAGEEGGGGGWVGGKMSTCSWVLKV